MGWIYLIESPSGKAYVGQTRMADPAKRLKQHLFPSNRCHALRNALNKYGGVWENGTIKNFVVSMYFCPDDQLDAHEELMIESLGTLVPDGYNLKTGGKAGRHTEETKRKISEWSKTMSEASRAAYLAKMSEGQRGRVHSVETRAKKSAALKGRPKPPMSAEARAQLSAKRSAAQKGKVYSAETRAKISAAQKGKVHSAETRAKISAAATKRWAAWKAMGTPISDV